MSGKEMVLDRQSSGNEIWIFLFHTTLYNLDRGISQDHRFPH